MSKFILQVTFDNNIQDILLKTQDYCYRFSDRDHDYANEKLLTSLTLGYNSDQLIVQKPISQKEEKIRNIAIITLQHIFQIPLVFEDRGEASSVEQMYAQFIKTDLPADKELHIVAYMSLCNKEDIACLEKFINSFPRNLTITVDVVLLPVSLKKKLTDAEKQEFKTNLQDLISIKVCHSDCFGNIFYSQSIDAIGATHDFDLNEQIKIYGAIILSLMNGYDCVSSQATDYPITVIGLSSVEIDKFAIVNNWAQYFIRGLISPLIETESASYTVNVNKVQQVLSDILKEEKEMISKITGSDAIGDDVSESFKKKILSIILGSDLNPKERKYLLECCMELSKRTPESIETLDVNSIAVPDALFVELLSEFCGDDKYQELLTVIQRIQALKKNISKQEKLIEEKRKLISENYPFDGELTEEGFVIHGNRYKPYTHTEEPLESDYSPSNLNLATSADLRKYFSVIKDQGEQGACASFSLVSVFEYFLSNEISKTEDLSEAFVYYNARERAGDTNSDSGATLQNIIKTMTDNGVCVEELCPYNEKEYSQKPTEEAYSDGAKRKVISALNVPTDVNTIKSAINEGYPVVASFRVFDSLAKSTAGFVSMPTEKERSSDKEDYHAMVICGYSDKQGYFIVRNSWGKDFGDNGYCYIPYAYIRDKGLTRYACAITGIDSNKIKRELDDFKYNHLDHDDNIQYAVLKNQLLEEQYKLNINREELKTALNRYRQLLQSIMDGDSLDDIKAYYEAEIEKKEKELKKLLSEEPEHNAPTNKYVRVVSTALTVISAVILGLGIYKHTQNSSLLLMIVGAVLFLLSFIGICIFIFKKRKEKNIYNVETQGLRLEIDNLKKELEKKIEIHKTLSILISNVNNISENSIMRSEILLAIEAILHDAYNWISDKIDTEEKGISYLDIYKRVVGLLKDKWNLLASLLVDGLDRDKIQDIFHAIQKEILRKFNAEFDIKIEDEYSIESDNWKQFKKQITDTVVLAQLSLTGNEPCSSVLFSNVKGVDIQNCYPVYVNNNQYLYLFLRRISINNLAIFSTY